ncbi:metallophosphoesterase [Candidatus Woesearchaeota archaeon]|nr:metallophosphoesterase [Candidatus Woesearchaeota archaeon]
MKLLVFGDNHGDIESFLALHQKAKEADIIVCLGDFTWFGQYLEEMLALIATFPKKVIVMHGNHEQEELVRQTTAQINELDFSHKEIIQAGDFTIITYGGGGFDFIDEEFEEFAKEIKTKVQDPHKTILILHAPPHNTALDVPFRDYHSGTISFRKFIEEFQPLIVFSGHIHEGEGVFDYIEETLLHNPGPTGQLVDLANLHKQRITGKQVKFIK